MGLHRSQGKRWEDFWFAGMLLRLLNRDKRLVNGTVDCLSVLQIILKLIPPADMLMRIDFFGLTVLHNLFAILLLEVCMTSKLHSNFSSLRTFHIQILHLPVTAVVCASRRHI